jgi:hypothetical protein
MRNRQHVHQARQGILNFGGTVSEMRSYQAISVAKAQPVHSKMQAKSWLEPFVIRSSRSTGAEGLVPVRVIYPQHVGRNCKLDVLVHVDVVQRRVHLLRHYPHQTPVINLTVTATNSECAHRMQSYGARQRKAILAPSTKCCFQLKHPEKMLRNITL